MNPRSKVWTRCVFAVMVLFLVGCNATETDQDIVITFDGEECMIDGPTMVSEGERIITLKNNTDWEVALDIAKVDEGKTWQDMADYLGEPGADVDRPSWASPPMKSSVPDNPEAWKYSLTEGLYAIVCWRNELPWGKWLGAPLEVKGE